MIADKVVGLHILQAVEVLADLGWDRTRIDDLINEGFAKG